MNTFKKLFATVAAVMVVASTVPANVFAASYDAETQAAYDYAFGAGLTTQSTIDGARMFDNTTRAEFAKIASVYATEVLGMTADTSASCSFTDLSAIAGSDLVGYVTTACQLGLMGVGTNGIFNPTGILSRAEAFTVIDRMLNGNTNDGGTPFYAAHLNALHAAGLVNDISNPMRAITRGNAFIVLQRTEDTGSTPAVCQDPMVQLSCALGLSDCPAECSGDNTDNGGDNGGDDNVVHAGDLDVSLNSATLANNSQIPKAGTVRFAAVDFDAGGEDISLSSVTIAKVGLATVPSTTRVWFEKDGVRITGRAAFTSDGTAVLSFAPAFEVKKNATETLDLYVELAAPGSAGDDYQFKSTDVNSSAQNVNGHFVTPVLRTANYTVSSAVFANVAGGGTANVTEDAQELGAFSIATTNGGNDIRDSILKSVTLRQTDNGDLSNLDNIVLERNGEVVSTDYVINGRDITFSTNDEIKDAASATYYLKANVINVDQSSDGYQFELRLNSDLNIVEKTTAFRLTVTGGGTSLSQYLIQGGDITFLRDTSIPLSTNVAAGTQNVVLMKGSIKTNSAITLENPVLVYGNLDVDADYYSGFSTIYMSIGGSTFSYSPTAGGTATGAEFNGSATVNGTANVKVWGTLKDNAPANVYKLNSLGLSSFVSNGNAGIAEYVSNGNTVASAIGSIEGINVTVQGSTLNVTRIDGFGSQTVAGGSNNVSVLKLSLSSTQGNGVRVSRFVFNTGTTTNSAVTNQYISLTILVDGVERATKTLNSSTVTFDVPSFKVDATHTHTVELKANFNAAFTSGQFNLGLPAVTGINAVDALTSTAVTYSATSTATFTVATAGAQVTANTSPVKTQLLLSAVGTDLTKIMSFRVKATNDNVQLSDLTFTGTNLDALSNFTLTDANGTVVATSTTNTASAVTFDNIADAPSVIKDAQPVIYFIKAKVNSNTSNVSVAMSLTAVNVKGTNGAEVAATAFTTITSNTHVISENRFVVADATTTKNLNTSAMKFTINAEGKTGILLNTLSFDTSIFGYTGTAEVRVYKDGSTDLAGTGTIALGATTNSPITLSTYNEVAAGTTATYTVKVVGVGVDPSSNSHSWSLTLNDIAFNAGFGTLQAAAYETVGATALPITSSVSNG